MRISRRALLAGSVLLPGCTVPAVPATPPSPEPEASPPSPTATASGPFQLPLPATVHVAEHVGPLGAALLDPVVRFLREEEPGLRVVVTSSSTLRTTLGPELDATVVDLIHDGVSDPLPLATAAPLLRDLTDLLEAPNLEGVPVRETLRSGVVASQTIDGRVPSLDYLLVAHGLWYSDAYFSDHGLTRPFTWAELLELGDLVREDGRQLFSWEESTALDFLDLALTMATKDAGPEVPEALDAMDPAVWEHPRVVAALGALEELVGTPQLTEQVGATAAWASGAGAVLHPGPSWVVRQTRGVMRETFRPTVSPVPTLAEEPLMPPSSILRSTGETFLVPEHAGNPEAALELLRVLCSPEVAATVAAANDIPTVVRGSTPAEPSAAFATQARLIADAGANTFDWRFVRHYGLSGVLTPVMVAFLRGEQDTRTTADALRTHCVQASEAPSVVPLPPR